MPKNLVYFGSPEFSADILASIIDSEHVNVVGVVTQPDTPQGRKQVLTPTAVALLAETHNLPTYKPKQLDDANLAHLRLLKPDIFLVASFGKIIPQTWLDLPSIGTFNIHFSLLPKYRGALCISEAIKNQDKKTGVTLMEMEAGLDSGAIIYQQDVKIDNNDNVADLTTKLTQAAQEITVRSLPEICSGNYPKTPQDDSEATYTKSHKTLTRKSAYIPWSQLSRNLSPKETVALHANIRSLNPEPGAWTIVSHTEVKILQTSLTEGKLTIDTVQIPGKQPISWKQFLSGHNI